MTCNICGGTGKVPCSSCGGTGALTTTAHGITGSMSISGPCPLCARTGFRRCTCGSRGSSELKEALYQEIAKFAYNEIVPFEHINGIVPQLTSYRAVREFFGEPDFGGRLIFGRGSLFYKSYGFAVGIEDEMVKDVTAAHPFHGKTPNGLYLGLAAAAAKKICDEEYIQINKGVKDFWVYRKIGKYLRFCLAISNDKLHAMTVKA